jgi:hypothetical protein
MELAIGGDPALMAAFLRKEPDATRQLYDRLASRIYGLGLFLLRNTTDAEDLVQETFLKIWRTGSAFDPVRGPLDAWILLSARSVAAHGLFANGPRDVLIHSLTRRRRSLIARTASVVGCDVRWALTAVSHRPHEIGSAPVDGNSRPLEPVRGTTGRTRAFAARGCRQCRPIGRGRHKTRSPPR